MRRINFKTIIISALVIFYCVLAANKFNIFDKTINLSPLPQTKYQAKCTRVIDGDTIEVLFVGSNRLSDKTEKIRFIGVNTPEMNFKKKEEPEYWAREATAFTKQELENRYIELQFDNISEQQDRYGRYLCYVWNDNYLFNQILIESGNGFYYPEFEFNNKMMDTFYKAETYARKNEMGMWKNVAGKEN